MENNERNYRNGKWRTCKEKNHVLTSQLPGVRPSCIRLSGYKKSWCQKQAEWRTYSSSKKPESQRYSGPPTAPHAQTRTGISAPALLHCSVFLSLSRPFSLPLFWWWWRSQTRPPPAWWNRDVVQVVNAAALVSWIRQANWRISQFSLN